MKQRIRFWSVLVLLWFAVVATIRAGDSLQASSDGIPFSWLAYLLALILIGAFGWWAKELKKSNDRHEKQLTALVYKHNALYPLEKIEI